MGGVAALGTGGSSHHCIMLMAQSVNLVRHIAITTDGAGIGGVAVFSTGGISHHCIVFMFGKPIRSAAVITQMVVVIAVCACNGLLTTVIGTSMFAVGSIAIPNVVLGFDDNLVTVGAHHRSSAVAFVTCGIMFATLLAGVCYPTVVNAVDIDRAGSGAGGFNIAAIGVFQCSRLNTDLHKIFCFAIGTGLEELICNRLCTRRCNYLAGSIGVNICAIRCCVNRTCRCINNSVYANQRILLQTLCIDTLST